jgi:hypothetical protein
MTIRYATTMLANSAAIVNKKMNKNFLDSFE